MFGNPRDAERALTAWESMVEARAAQARQIATRTAELSATAAVADGLVVATVDYQGQLSDLRLDERVRPWPLERLAKTVMAAEAAARQALAAEIRQILDDSRQPDA